MAGRLNYYGHFRLWELTLFVMRINAYPLGLRINPYLVRWIRQ